MMTARLNVLEATPAAYREAARGIRADPPPDLTPLRLAVLSTFTASPLEPYIVVEAARRGLGVEPWFGPYNQLEQLALDGDSALYACRPEVIVIAARLEDLVPDLFWRFASFPPEAIDARLASVAERYESLVAGIRRHGAATVLLANFTEPVCAPLGLAGALHDPSPGAVVERANAALAALARRAPGVYVLDLARAALEIGLDRWSDAKLAHLARLPWSLAAQIEVGKRLARHLRALTFPARKCLVVDLDDTLWGGVVGEDGLDGLALGAEYPGSAFADFQRALAGLRARGVLLAIASKNDPATVREVFDKHADMVLRWEDFAAAEIHWNDKASSLRAIAHTLGIGTDALAFYDDSPLEREWVRAQLPEVAVIDVPASPLERVRALDDSAVFDQLRVSDDDRRRADAYREEGDRERLRAAAVSPEEFWRGLGTTVRVGAVDPENLARVVQLMAKTNQFTVTTRRHSAAQVEAMLGAGALGLWLRARDRYGDYGLVGVALALPDTADAWRIDSFLLSCRALGRQVEGALLAALARRVAGRGGRRLIGEFVATGRNQPAERFFADHRFAPLDGDGRMWRLDLDAAALEPPPFVTLETHDEVAAPGGGNEVAAGGR
jgi:FkbH-like protein